MSRNKPQDSARTVENLTTTDGSDPEQIKEEPGRANRFASFRRIFRRIISAVIAVIAIAAIAAVFIFPIFRIYGSSMSSTLKEGDIVVAVKTTDIKAGDIIAFNNGSELLVKRVIGTPGDRIEIGSDGTVSVNNSALLEPYVRNKTFGECDIEMPYTVPSGHFFVMGDNREISSDSRNTSVGCAPEEEIIGKIVFCVWPLKDFGKR